MIKKIDSFLNQITMYRLVLYFLLILNVAAVVLSFFGLLPYGPINLLGSMVIAFAVCMMVNVFCAWVLKVPTNVESVYITAFILTVIVAPPKGVGDISFLIWSSCLAIASKYIVAMHKKHLFNPAAFGVAIAAIVTNQSANWWVDVLPLLPIVLVGGLLIVRKVRRFKMVFTFLFAALLAIIIFTVAKGGDPVAVIGKAFLHTPLLFFAFVMLTEPLTTPPTANLQIGYGLLTGILFAPQVHLGQIYSTPELALIVGNIFSYAVSPKKKHLLTLVEKIKITLDTYDFVFNPSEPLKFRPGQYLEWTVGHKRPDNRGNRRYFTICSSPTEALVRAGIKFYPRSSSFKESLGSLSVGDKIMAGQLAGDFVLPKDKRQKLVFIAGGIGITPFRSMIKYLLDNHEQRSITLVYSNKTKADILYQEIWNQAERELGIKTVHTLTDPQSPGSDWRDRTGFISEALIKDIVPDYEERIFYISGPQAMVTTMHQILTNMGIKKTHIKTDFFPGLV